MFFVVSGIKPRGIRDQKLVVSGITHSWFQGSLIRGFRDQAPRIRQLNCAIFGHFRPLTRARDLNRLLTLLTQIDHSKGPCPNVAGPRPKHLNLTPTRGAHPTLCFQRASVAPRHRERYPSSAGRNRFLNQKQNRREKKSRDGPFYGQK